MSAGEAGGVGGRRPRPLTPLLPTSGPGNHNYCRNPDQDPRGPWCYISSETGVPEKRPCEDVSCPGTRPGTTGKGLQPCAPSSAAAVTPAAHVRPLDARPAPSPPPRRPIGQSYLQAAELKAHWPPQHSE